jgi:site-specific recombinase
MLPASPPAAEPAAALHVPDVGAFGLALAPQSPKSRLIKRLHADLGNLDVEANMLDREAALVRLAAFVRKGPAPAGTPVDRVAERAPIKRLRLLVAALEAFPAYAARLAYVVGATLLEQRADAFFAKLGIPGDRGLFSETVDRLSQRLMPQPIDEEDVTHTLALMFPSASDAEWLAAVPAELAVRFMKTLRRQGVQPMRGSFSDAGPASVPPPAMHRGSQSHLPLGAQPSLPDDVAGIQSGRRYSIWAPLRASLLDAILILASRVSSAGLSDAIRDRSPPSPLRDSPFFRLPRTIDALLATPRHDTGEILAWADDCRAAMLECREACHSVLEHLEQKGVSVDVVYRLELIERSLTRIELLLELLVPQAEEDHAHRATQVLAALLNERRRTLSLMDIVRTNTHMLARKIIERAGHTGEHYITVTVGEYFKLFASAAGGGVVAGLMAAGKIVLGKLHRPPLQEGLLFSCNYAGCFLLMQFLGFTLATKQPSMTAAALAGAVKHGGEDKRELVNIIARLSRSQLAAAAGNMLMVAPASILVDFLWRRAKGEHLLTTEYAMKTIAALHPTESGTIPFAIYTGVVLWASSLCAGWLENWAVYRRLPEAIAEHRVRRIVGRRVTEWASRVFARNISGIGGNVSIGVMLGMTYSLGQFSGIPVDVRHVTLSTGSLTYAVLALGTEVIGSPAFTSAVIGLAVILALNLSVSFSLALIVAFRAREVTVWQALRLPLDLAVGFVRSPLRFFFPVEGPSASQPAAHHHG